MALNNQKTNLKKNLVKYFALFNFENKGVESTKNNKFSGKVKTFVKL